jgi:hypothetical protein
MRYLLAAILVVSLLSMASAAKSEQLVASPGQLFWVNGSWIPADQLHPGETFTTPDGVGIITTIRDVALPGNASCFSLATAPPHDFVANNMLARDVSCTTGATLYAADPAKPESPIQLVLSKLQGFVSGFWRLTSSKACNSTLSACRPLSVAPAAAQGERPLDGPYSSSSTNGTYPPTQPDSPQCSQYLQNLIGKPFSLPVLPHDANIASVPLLGPKLAFFQGAQLIALSFTISVDCPDSQTGMWRCAYNTLSTTAPTAGRLVCIPLAASDIARPPAMSVSANS